MAETGDVKGYIRPRGGMLEAVIKVDGRKIPKATGLRVGQEAEAEAVLAQAIAALQASSSAPLDPSAALTVRAWGAHWNDDRKARGKREWVTELAHLKYFVYPVLGDIPLADVTDENMIDWARGLEKARGPSGKSPSSKYIRKITATARALFKEAVRRHRIPRTPCVWEDTDLPEPEANARVMNDGFDLDEVARLIYDERIPEDRRALYALEFLTGMRTGEAAARTWADWEPEYSGDLGRLVARTAYNTRHHILKATKTRVEKWIPVHPELARILAAWKEEGWERLTGRKPTPEDLIVPAREGGPRNNSYSWRMFQQDTETLELRAQRHYETRSTFINLAEGGGAPPDVIRRITHPSIRDAKDLYSRARLRWPGMCAAVKAIRIAPPTNGEIALRIACGTGSDANLPSSTNESGSLGETGNGGRAWESNPPAAPFSTTHRF